MVTFDAKDGSVIRTVVQVDGLGRAVRTAKTGCVSGIDGWNASGAVEYDDKGRTVKAGTTEFIKGDLDDLLSSAPKMTSLFTSYEYDERDRAVRTVLPDGSAQTNAFYVDEYIRIQDHGGPESRYKDAPNYNYNRIQSPGEGIYMRRHNGEKYERSIPNQSNLLE